jgi:hypothetical protein
MLTAFWDTRWCPVSHDFVTFSVIADSERKKRGAVPGGAHQPGVRAWADDI